MPSAYSSKDGQVITLKLDNGDEHKLDYREASSLVRGLEYALNVADENVALIKQHGTSDYRAVSYARALDWFGPKVADQCDPEGKRIYEEANKETV